MLVNISASNFKSFDKTERLSMISSSKIQTHTDHVRKIKDTKILKNAVIYGANASGKSNLVEILQFMQWTLQLLNQDYFFLVQKRIMNIQIVNLSYNLHLMGNFMHMVFPYYYLKEE